MSKLLKIIVAAVFLASTAHAAQFNLGVSGMIVDLDADGSETLKTTGVVAKKTHNETFGAGEIFLEVAPEGGGLTLGVAVIPAEAEIGSNSLARTDILTDNSGSSVTNKASAEFSGHTTVYIALPVRDTGFYLKAGMGQVDVQTTESLGTGAAYGDQSIDFVTIGAGYERSLDNGLFARVEGTYADYDKVELKSTGSDAVSTVTGEIDSMTARVSIGKSF